MFGSEQRKQNRLNSALWKAAQKGNVDKMRKLIADGADVEAKGGERFRWSMTPLNAAALFGQTEAVRCLLEAGADANTQDKYGDRPLRNAAIRGEATAEMVGLLLQHGADPRLTNRDGLSVLSRLSDYKADVRELLAPTPPAPPPEEPNRDEVVLRRKLGDRLLEETYNFADRERITMVRATEGGPVEAITRDEFSALQGNGSLRRAFEEYARKGGTVPEAEIFPAELLKAKPAPKAS